MLRGQCCADSKVDGEVGICSVIFLRGISQRMNMVVQLTAADSGEQGRKLIATPAADDTAMYRQNRSGHGGGKY